MSDSIEIAKRYFDIIPTLEFSSVSAVLNAGTESSMRKAYRPDALVWAMAHELEALTAEIQKRDELLKAAKCPSCNGGGVHLDIDSEYIKCEWCDEVNKLKGEG